MDRSALTGGATLIERIWRWRNAFAAGAGALLFHGLLLVLVAAPTQVSVKIGPAHLAPVDPLIWGLFVAWLISNARDACRPAFRPPPATALFFTVAVALSVARAAGKIEALKDLVQAAEYFPVAIILFLNVLRTPRAARLALTAHLAAAAAVLALAAVQYLHPAVDAFDVRGAFGNRNILGGYLSLTLPLMFALACFGGFDRRWRIALGFMTAAGLLINLSGATLLALLPALGLTALCRGRRAAALTAAALLLTVVVALPRMPRDNFRELHESVAVFDADYELSARYGEWLAALSMWHEQPLLIGGAGWLRRGDGADAPELNPMGWLVGVGAGNFQRNIGMYYGYLPQVNINVTEPDSHNTYLVLLSTVGLLGLLGFGGMLLQSAGRALRGWGWEGEHDPLERGMRIGAAAALLAYSINAVWAGLLVRGIGIPLAFTLALPFLFPFPRPDGINRGDAAE